MHWCCNTSTLDKDCEVYLRNQNPQPKASALLLSKQSQSLSKGLKENFLSPIKEDAFDQVSSSRPPSETEKNKIKEDEFSERRMKSFFSFGGTNQLEAEDRKTESCKASNFSSERRGSGIYNEYTFAPTINFGDVINPNTHIEPMKSQFRRITVAQKHGSSECVSKFKKPIKNIGSNKDFQHLQQFSNLQIFRLNKFPIQQL